jgi:hypothetical protein
MRGAGLSGWSDALDISLDGAEPMLKQLAAEKLMSEGVIQPSLVAQPTFYAVSQTATAPLPPSPGNADFAKVVVAILVVLILFGR